MLKTSKKTKFPAVAAIQHRKLQKNNDTEALDNCPKPDYNWFHDE
jgi:hypothetical protein